MVCAFVRLRSAALLLLLLSSACAEVADVEEMVDQSDAGVRREMNVKTALLNADDVWGSAIRVIYADGAIRLQGFVNDAGERRRALEAARQAEPDVAVIDELEVWNEASDPGT